VTPVTKSEREQAIYWMLKKVRWIRK